MNILLLNDNPVVTKLVTLSAQKTSNELDIVTSAGEIENKNYDLLVIDDTSYTQGITEEIKSKTNYKKSLYICSHDSQEVEGFTATLKKPFLPTDLVGLFVSFSKDINVVDSSNKELNTANFLNEVKQEDDDFLKLDVDDVEELNSIEDDFIDDDISLDDLGDMNLDSEFIDEGVLDKNELQKVQKLLKEAEDIEIDDLKESDTKEIDDLTTNDEEELDLKEELNIDSINDEDLENEIENAVLNLDEEELEREVDFDTLLDIAANDLDALDTFDTRDIKSTIDEETTPQELKIDKKSEVGQNEQVVEKDNTSQDVQTHEDNEGVEALKKLLEALSSEGVAASMKGMKININITLGEK